MRQIKLLYWWLAYDKPFPTPHPKKKEINFKRNYAGTFDVSCGMFSNVPISSTINLVLRGSDTDSENVNLIRRSISEGQKTYSSKGVPLIGI